jgi:hypothetical protein
MSELIEKMKNYNHCHTIFAKRNSGKSYLSFILLYELKDTYDYIFIFSGTLQQQPLFKNDMKHLFDFKNVKIINHSEEIEELKQVNKKADFNTLLQFYYKKIQQINLYNEENDLPQQRFLFLFDDILSNDPTITKRLKDSSLSRIYTEGRHNNITLIFLIQSLSFFDGSFIGNTDYFTCFNFKKFSEIEYLFKKLSTIDRKSFNKMLEYVFDEKYNILTFDMNDFSIYKNLKPIDMNQFK